jgi:hypothetical protein
MDPDLGAEAVLCQMLILPTASLGSWAEARVIDIR